MDSFSRSSLLNIRASHMGPDVVVLMWRGALNLLHRGESTDHWVAGSFFNEMSGFKGIPGSGRFIPWRD